MTEHALHPGRACLECRRRKTKCDGIQPLCGRCARLSKKCVFETVARRPRTERLQDKIKELESELEALSASRRSVMDKLLERLDDRNASQTRKLGQYLPIFPLPSTSRSERSTGLVSREDFEEGYASLIPRTAVEKSLSVWMASGQDVPSELHDYLVRLFLPFRSQFHFYMDLSTFLSCLQLPASHPRALHPALVNVIYLAACSVSGGYLSGFEQVFLSLARSHLEQSLAYADRLMHFMWASVILGVYYSRAGRIIEAYNTMSATVRFAVGCGLHRTKADGSYGGPDAMTLPPADEQEARERIVLWHAIFLTDRAVSAATDLPISAPEEDSMTSFEALNFLHPLTDERGTTMEDPIMMKVKVNTLMCAVLNFVAASKELERSNVDDRFWESFNTLDAAISSYRKALPSIDDPRGLDTVEAVSAANPFLFQGHSGSLACTILLYNVVAKEHPEADAKVLSCARAMAGLAKHMRKGFGNYLPIQATLCILLHTYTGCEVFIREVKRNQACATPEQRNRLALAYKELDPLLDQFLDLTLIFPAWRRCLKKMRALLSGNESFEVL